VGGDVTATKPRETLYLSRIARAKESTRAASFLNAAKTKGLDEAPALRPTKSKDGKHGQHPAHSGSGFRHGSGSNLNIIEIGMIRVSVVRLVKETELEIESGCGGSKDKTATGYSKSRISCSHIRDVGELGKSRRLRSGAVGELYFIELMAIPEALQRETHINGGLPHGVYGLRGKAKHYATAASIAANIE
jgi:hypothetical protein